MDIEKYMQILDILNTIDDELSIELINRIKNEIDIEIEYRRFHC